MKTMTQNEKSHRLAMAATFRSGEAGIRTLGTLARTLVFETSTIGHSVTSPKADRRRANHTPPLPSFPDGCAPFRRPASVAIGPASGAAECIELPHPILFNLDKNNQHFASSANLRSRLDCRQMAGFLPRPNVRLRKDTNPNGRVRADLRAPDSIASPFCVRPYMFRMATDVSRPIVRGPRSYEKLVLEEFHNRPGLRRFTTPDGIPSLRQSTERVLQWLNKAQRKDHWSRARC
jgi:hypothetical protein